MIPIILIVFLQTCSSLYAQSNETSFFVGINPGITAEPYYEDGEYDVNILPLVFQKPIFNKFHIRLNSILNYGLREDENNFSHIGGEIGFPYFFFNQFYISPLVGITKNNLESTINIVNAIEPGYHFIFENDFSLFAGIQIGNTYFIYDDKEENEWKNHFGIKIMLGKWF
jgi:hypothetical protein